VLRLLTVLRIISGLTIREVSRVGRPCVLLIVLIQELGNHMRIGGRQLADVVLADVGGCASAHAVSARNKRQPAGQSLLSGAAIGKKENLVGKKSCVDRT